MTLKNIEITNFKNGGEPWREKCEDMKMVRRSGARIKLKRRILTKVSCECEKKMKPIKKNTTTSDVGEGRTKKRFELTF